MLSQNKLDDLVKYVLEKPGLRYNTKIFLYETISQPYFIS